MGDDRPHDPLVVERPQVLQRAAAAGEDRHRGRVVGRPAPRSSRDPALEPPERPDDARRRLLALDLARDEHDPGSGQRRARTWHDVAPDGAGRAGDDGDRPRPRRQRALAGRVEQALRGEPRLERLEPQRQVAEPRRLDRLDVELERALRLEQVDPAVGDDPEPGLRLERRADAVVAEPDALELRSLVLEREVGVPGGLTP